MRPYKLTFLMRFDDRYVQRIQDVLFMAGSDAEAIMQAREATAPTARSANLAELRDENSDLVWSTPIPSLEASG